MNKEVPQKSQYTVDEMIEKMRVNINRSAEFMMERHMGEGCAGALIAIAQGLNILARQNEREWESRKGNS